MVKTEAEPSDIDNDNEQQLAAIDTITKPKGLGIRHLQIMLLFTGLLLAYALRVNISIGIVAMVDNAANPSFVEYDWDETTRSMLLSSFFWGYIISNIPAGILCQRYGPKLFLLMSLSVCSVLTLMTELFAAWGWEYLIANRVLQGLAQGFVYPGVHTMLSRWVHPSERGFLSTFTYSGTQLGTVVMLAVSGVIAESSAGWPGIFYISGGLAAIWAITWLWLGCNSPSLSTRISHIEREFIESTKGMSTPGERKRTPWLSILMSMPFWAVLIAHSAQNWGFWTLLTEIPTYMKNVLDFDIKQNALLSAMPYFVMFLLCIVFSQISDFLTNRHLISNGTARKLFNSLGHWVPALTMIGLGYVSKEDSVIAVVLLTISVGMNASSYLGYLINHMDLSPNFAGTLMGVTNALSNVMSILGPLLVGLVVKDETDPNLWRIIFFVAAGFFLVGNLIFVVFGSATIQPWNNLEADSSKSSATTMEMRKQSVDSFPNKTQ